MDSETFNMAMFVLLGFCGVIMAACLVIIFAMMRKI